jgi:hypothetical protein
MRCGWRKGTAISAGISKEKEIANLKFEISN